MPAAQRDADRIKPASLNPFYFQYRGAPVLLLGGSVEDNLFQIPDLEAHLDLLASVGGNYIRCTMSSRDEGNVWAYPRDPGTGLYDLTRWDDEYWRRFSTCLELTAARDIIVQVEIWATWDFYRLGDFWRHNAYNPANNSTYDSAQSGLPEVWEYMAPERINPFFETVPDLQNNTFLLAIQKAFVDKLLSYTLPYDHVLYCMDNETNADPRWGFFWNEYIRSAAAAQGVTIETTDMWDNWDPSNGAVPNTIRQDTSDHPFLDRSNVLVTIAHPERYSFVEISNHNAQRGETHYKTAMFVRDRLQASDTIRPVTCVKIYGADASKEFSGTPRDGLERFWRNVFAGVAAVRFHRPTAGLGLSEVAQAHIRSMRMLTDELDVWSCEPHNDLLSDRATNSCYCLADPGCVYAVCFLDGGQVRLDCSAAQGELAVRWLDVGASSWSAPETARGATLDLQAPGEGFWAVLIQPHAQS